MAFEIMMDVATLFFGTVLVAKAHEKDLTGTIAFGILFLAFSLK